MYDLVKSKIIDGKIIFYCINDQKENEIINKYIALIKNNSFKNKKGKASVKISNSPYVLTSILMNLWVNKPEKSYSLHTSKIFSGIATETLKPPNNLI